MSIFSGNKIYQKALWSGKNPAEKSVRTKEWIKTPQEHEVVAETEKVKTLWDFDMRADHASPSWGSDNCSC